MNSLPPAGDEVPAASRDSILRTQPRTSEALFTPSDKKRFAAADSVLKTEREGADTLNASLSLLEETVAVAQGSAEELARNRETISSIKRHAVEVGAAADDGRATVNRMQRRTGFWGVFVQAYEAVTGK